VSERKKLKVVIAGGGTAGWMTACALSAELSHCIDIVLVESEEIGSVGVGEATIPTMQTFHLLARIDETEFLKKTSGTYKLGIQFENWGQLGEKYFHSFGTTGKDNWAGGFQHTWLRSVAEGWDFSFGDFSLETQAANDMKFATTRNPRMSYAYHLNAFAYAQYLRQLSESRGVVRREGKIKGVQLCHNSGNIQGLALESGEDLIGDFFIDCTGFRAMLIGQSLKTPYEEWTDLFLCDRAVAVQTELGEAPPPFTRSIAHPFGWQWRIPLQSRVGNGFVYSSYYMSDDEARALLMAKIQGKAISEPRSIKFRPGRRVKSWNKNCVAIGLSSGFIEPLESTSIHLISSAIVRLMRLLPEAEKVSALLIDEYNRESLQELHYVRDFVALHYKLTKRDDSEFWRLNSWNQVLLGQGLVPRAYHPAAQAMRKEELRRFLSEYRSAIQSMVKKMPSHQDFIAANCRA